MQGCVYPLLAYVAFQSKNVSFKEWCEMSWREARGGFAERAWFSLFFGYLLKDMFVMDDALFLLHHVACMLGVVRSSIDNTNFIMRPTQSSLLK